jgi:hypothetical protein
MMYENGKDREQQGLAAHQYEGHLRRLGVTQCRLIETPEPRREHYDFEIREGEQGQLWTGVLEVKSRKVSERQVEEWGSIVIEVERLAFLKKQFFLVSPITGKAWWTKNIVFVWRCVLDDVCFSIDMPTLLKHYSDFEDAPPEMMKTDHGTKDKDVSGKLIPIFHMERFS